MNHDILSIGYGRTQVGGIKMNKKIPKILEFYEDYLKSTIKLSNQIRFTLEDTKPWENFTKVHYDWQCC